MAAIWATGGFDDPAGYDFDRMITWLLDGIERLADSRVALVRASSRRCGVVRSMPRPKMQRKKSSSSVLGPQREDLPSRRAARPVDQHLVDDCSGAQPSRPADRSPGTDCRAWDEVQRARRRRSGTRCVFVAVGLRRPVGARRRRTATPPQHSGSSGAVHVRAELSQSTKPAGGSGRRSRWAPARRRLRRRLRAGGGDRRGRGAGDRVRADRLAIGQQVGQGGDQRDRQDHGDQRHQDPGPGPRPAAVVPRSSPAARAAACRPAERRPAAPTRTRCPAAARSRPQRADAAPASAVSGVGLGLVLGRLVHGRPSGHSVHHRRLPVGGRCAQRRARSAGRGTGPPSAGRSASDASAASRCP